MPNFFPERLHRRLQSRSRFADVAVENSRILLTGTQVGAQNALVAALLKSSELIVLTGKARFGKTTVLAAALACIADSSLEVIRLDDLEGGMEDAFQTLFTTVQQAPGRRQAPERRIVLVTDQAETMPTGTLEYLELLTRMPGKGAAVQLVIVGRPEFWECIGGPAVDRLREAVPVHLALSSLSEQDAWELFHHRVSPAHAHRSARKVVTTLMEGSGGSPGRFDQVLRRAVAAGILTGVPG